MSVWTHSVCTNCWNSRHPSRVAVKSIRGPEEKCCDCGEKHQSGIYLRADPNFMNCRGQHSEDSTLESTR